MTRIPPGLLGLLTGSAGLGAFSSIAANSDGPPQPNPEIMALHHKARKTGTALCGCGRTISRNKDQCLACMNRGTA